MNSLVLNSLNSQNQISGLYYTIFSGYFADNVNWFNTAIQKTGTSSLYATDFTSLLLATNNQGIGDNFSVHWYGNIVTPAGSGGIWTFSTRSDDASYLWIGNNASSGYTTLNSVVNNGGAHSPKTLTGTISLTENTSYNIRVQFGESGGGEELSITFQKPNNATVYTLSTANIVLYS